MIRKFNNFESSNILSVEYDTDKKQLIVKFKSSPSTKYIYCSVQPKIFQQIQISQSVGKFICQKIKPKYCFRKQSLILG